MVTRLSLGVLLLAGCGPSPEASLRRTLATQTTGVIHLPKGRIEVSSALELAPGAHDLEIIGSGTVLNAAARFHGRAILSADGAHNLRLRDFSIDGNRAFLEKPLGLIPPENAFRVFYGDNGVWFDRVQGLEISNVKFASVTNFAILISRSSGIRIRGVDVRESGSRNAGGRNNMTGGIVIEEGSSDFEVRDCTFRSILGNALWTHSLYQSPRSRDGLFTGNRFDSIGRDAIQVGHATNIRVEENTGVRIGYPFGAVDLENQGTPVAIDTSGNVDHSTYARNQFEDVNGKCIDLDGFHDGAVRENRCTNRGAAQDYPAAQFGIVMNNTNPDMRPQNIEITGNQITGTRFGGLFVIGSGHRITGNVFERLNIAECNGCIYKADEPQMLESGIYLGREGSRPAETRGNIITDNRISGYKMKTRCIAAAPGISPGANMIERNTCSDAR